MPQSNNVPRSTEEAEATLAAKMVRPLDEMSRFSINEVAEAAAIIARNKAEQAAKAAEAARLAHARLLKARGELQDHPTPPEPIPVASEDKTTSTDTNDNVVSIAERRQTEPRRKISERRNTQDPVAADRRRLAQRRYSVGRRADDPSGVSRLADALRATSAAKSSEMAGNHTHNSRAKQPGSVLDPVAHQAGHGPTPARPKRSVVTPQIIMLFCLMLLFGMFATGNLPQADRLAESLLSSAQAHNQDVVNGVANHWHALGFLICGFLAAAIAFVVRQNMLRSQSRA